MALGTVADVVPLDKNNRTLVAAGIARMRAGRARPGIEALFEVAGRDIRSVTSTDLGFVAGPRINAAGRLDDMSVGIECLLSESTAAARSFATQLNDYNKERRSIEGSMQAEALALVESGEFAVSESDFAVTLIVKIGIRASLVSLLLVSKSVFIGQRSSLLKSMRQS